MTGPRPFQRSIEIAASLDALRPLGQWLQEATREAALPEEAASALDHALHEAVENVVRYAWLDTHGRSIRVRFRCDATQAEVEVEDDGMPFDPTSVPPPVAPTNLEHLEPGGYGVVMMRNFTDELLYRRDGTSNRLTLRRRVTSSLDSE